MKNKKEVLPVIPPKEIITGQPDAPVRLMMFGDYESEACSAANDVVKQLLEKYEGQLNFVFRHFPLTRIHQKAHKAAEAAIGAAQEGKFWEMHQQLYANHHNLGTISLKSHAREVGVTDKKFLDHLINSAFGWFVQDDLKEGMNLGVTDIPAFFINNVRFEQAPSLKNFSAQIDELLAPKRKSATVKAVSQKQRA